MINLVDEQSYNALSPDPDLPKTLDITILDLLVRHSLKKSNTFYGLSLPNILRALNGFKMYGGAPRFTRGEISEVRRALILLERNGLAHQIKRSKSRWFPSSRAVALHGIAEGSQTPITRWL